MGLLGIHFYNSMFPDSEETIRTGIVVFQNPSEQEELRIDIMQMQVNPIEKSMVLILDFTYFTTGNFSIGLALPFRVDSFSNITPKPSYPGEWSHINRPSGSLVTINYVVDELIEGRPEGITVAKKITFDENIVDKIYDVSSLDLPFRGSTTLEISRLVQDKGLHKTESHFFTTLEIVLPPHAPITTSTHEPFEKTPGDEYDVWRYYKEDEEFTPFYIQYSVPEDRVNFQSGLLYSGVLIGGALSAGVGGFHAILDTYYNKKKADDERENHPKKSKSNKNLTEDEKKFLLIEYSQLHNEIQQRNQYGWLIISIFVAASFLVSFGIENQNLNPLRYGVSFVLVIFSWFLNYYFDHVNKSCWDRRDEIESQIDGLHGPSNRFQKLSATMTYKIAQVVWITFWLFLIILYFHLFLFSIL